MPRLTLEASPEFTSTKKAFVTVNGQPIAVDQLMAGPLTLESGTEALVRAGVGSIAAEKKLSLADSGAAVQIAKGKMSNLFKALMILFVLLVAGSVVARLAFDIKMNMMPFLALMPIYMVLAVQASKPDIKVVTDPVAGI